MSKKQKIPPLEHGVITAMRAVDNQVARQMERSPAERDLEGVQKWAPHQQKVEQICALVLEAFGDDEVRFDSVLVTAQAFAKALYLLSEELGEVGLGSVRAGYAREALRNILRDAERGLSGLEDEKVSLN